MPKYAKTQKAVRELMRNMSTRGFPLLKYFIPGCVEIGVRLGSESLSSAGFWTALLIRGPNFKGVGLKLTAFMLTFRDPSSHVCQIVMRVDVLTDLELGSCCRIWDFSHAHTSFTEIWNIRGGHLQNQFFAGIWNMVPGCVSQIWNFQKNRFHPFTMNSY